MPGSGQAEDSARAKNASDTTPQSGGAKAPEAGVEKPLGCDDFVKHIVEYFYGMLPQERFTRDAQNHLRRVAAYSICFAFESSNNSHPDWWKGKAGKVYWEKHAENLVGYLPKDSKSLINGRVLHRAILDYAPKFRRRLEALLTRLQVRGYERKLQEERVGREPEDPRLNPADIVKMLDGCPFKM